MSACPLQSVLADFEDACKSLDDKDGVREIMLVADSLRLGGAILGKMILYFFWELNFMQSLSFMYHSRMNVCLNLGSRSIPKYVSSPIDWPITIRGE